MNVYIRKRRNVIKEYKINIKILAYFRDYGIDSMVSDAHIISFM